MSRWLRGRLSERPRGDARRTASGIDRRLSPVLFLPLLLAVHLVGAGESSAAESTALPGSNPARSTVLADFNSGAVTLSSYSAAEDRDPNSWQLTQSNAHGGAGWSLRLYGNTWKSQSITPYPVSAGTVFRVSIYIEEKAETQAFGVSDGVNTLFYSVAGTVLQTGVPWELAYQGASSTQQWQTYELTIGRDWMMRYGYAPTLTNLVYVNNRDLSAHGMVLFDDVEDITSDLPVAPQVDIVRGSQTVTRLEKDLFRVGIQFHAEVNDPDSGTFGYFWDFGDSTTSSASDPYHEFLVHADYTYTVNLGVVDDTGLWGRDSTQVAVEPGGSTVPLTMNFVGDVMLARSYDTSGGLIDTYGPEYIFIPTRSMYGDAAEVNVCNLECPLTNQGTPHPTKSIVFRGRPTNVAGLTYAGIDVVSMANNHVIDYGQAGMNQTQQVLDTARIRWSGAGDDDYLAMQPVFWTEHGVALAFLGQCNRTGRDNNEQPFLDAAAGKPGFAYLTEANITDGIHAVRSLADLVVVQLHAGIEYSTAPGSLRRMFNGLAGSGGEAGAFTTLSPEEAAMAARQADAAGPIPGEPAFLFPTEPALTDRQLRWRAVDEGADLVICHHPHVLQGFEAYHGKLIAHSLGNFVFDQSYAETFPSVVLQTEFDKTGFRSFTFQPVFIDKMIPQPAKGRLGREILDRMAEYSKNLNTVVTVDPPAMRGRILLDPASVVWTPETFARKVPLKAEGSDYVSPPIERDGLGVLSRILQVSAPGTVEIRVGRELLWHGDMEEEGATMWDLNSSSEVYDSAIYHQGLRSLRQKRLSSNTGPVVTDLQGYPPILDGIDFSLCGWLRAENAKDAGFAARFFSGRGGTALASYEAGDLVTGTKEWTWLWSDFAVSEAAAFMNVRPHMDKPDAGEAYAWFDELRLVQWEPWQPASLPLSVPYPSNLRFLQVRLAAPQDSVQVTWEDVRPEDVASQLPPVPGPSGAGIRLVLAPPAPNPFRGATGIEYRLSQDGPVRLEIFDVAGRRVASLFQGRQSAGPHRATWAAPGAASGLYFCRLESGRVVLSSKLVVLR